MNELPTEIHAHIMRMYFTHHVMKELSQLKYKERHTNQMVARFVSILDSRIRQESAQDNPNLKVLKRLRYARDRWNNHLFHEREDVQNVYYFRRYIST